MKEVNTTNTEEKILAAAEIEFTEKGRAGARMQQIADRAGINKALLHYYYRSKDKLFEMIFMAAFKSLAPKISDILNSQHTIEDKIRKFTFEYISLILKRPNIPVFIIHELGAGSSSILFKIISKIELDLSGFETQLNEEIAKGNIRPISTQQLVLNIISLCVLPIIAKPIATTLLFTEPDFDYNAMMEKRKIEVADFVINSIKLN